MASQDLLETLKQEITCPLCLEIFKQPKKLPCDHVYCRVCLRGLLARRTAGVFNCPECRVPVQVTSPDPDRFSTPYHINRLIEVYERGKREAQSAGSTDQVDSSAVNCKLHKSESLTLYCEMCKKLVCRDCVLFVCAKANHTYDYLENKYEQEKLALEGKLYPVKQLHDRMHEELKLTMELDGELGQNEQRVMEELEMSFQELFTVLIEEKTALRGAVERRFQEARADNSTRQEITQKLCNKLENVLKTIHQHDSPASFLAGMDARDHTIAEAIKSTDEMCTPRLDKVPNLGLSVLPAAKLRELCRENMYYYLKEAPLKCRISKIDWDRVSLACSTVINLELEGVMRQVNPRELKATLHCLHSRKDQNVDVVYQNRSFSLTLRPRERGRHQLHIKYEGKHIGKSPYQMFVVPNFANLTPQVTNRTLVQPMGIKCSQDRVYVSQLHTGLAVLELRSLAKISTIWMPDIWEVVVDANTQRIYGSDNLHNQVKMMTMQGEVLKTTGRHGNQPGQFQWPNGIRCSKKGEVIVCDTMNHRIQVFDKDLNFVKVVSHHTFSTPDDLDFDERGNWYVVNQNNHTISVLDSEGTYLRSIGTYGTRPGELANPVSVAVCKDSLYITDCANGRISVFDTRGKFVATFGEKTLMKPECVAVDQDGYVYVSDQREKLYTF